MATVLDRFYGTGRRKTSVARVWIRPGSGRITVNRRGFENYFPRETLRMIIAQPFQVTNTVDQFDLSVRSSARTRLFSSAMRRTSRSSPVIRPLMRRTAPCSVERRSILQVAWPVARMRNWQAGRQPQSAEMQAKPDVEALAIGETGGSGWIWLIWWIALFGGIG